MNCVPQHPGKSSIFSSLRKAVVSSSVLRAEEASIILRTHTACLSIVMDLRHEDARILNEFLSNFRDDSKPMDEQKYKYLSRLESIKNGSSKVLIIELDDLAVFSNSEARSSESVFKHSSTVVCYRHFCPELWITHLGSL